MVNLKENIKGLIKKSNKTQDFVAEKLGIKQGTLSQKIGQDSKIKFKTLLDIADILEIKVVDIITFPDTYVPEKKSCENCEQLRLEIRHLTDYIEILKKKGSNTKK